MNHKEVLEIKKQFQKDNFVITRFCGCYVNVEREIKLKTTDSFHGLSDEECDKYLTIFRQSLSGSMGKNLLNMEFPLNEEKPDGTQEFLLRLRDSKLEDEALIDEFYQQFVENYYIGKNYYIILIHCIYDIPGRNDDGSKMFDASENVYDYILCSICPVNLEKPGLQYNADKNSFEEKIRDWLVEAPVNGFLFPAFTDRNADIHSVLYYLKNQEEQQQNFVAELFGTRLPLTVKNQKETFNMLVEETLGDECQYETVKNIHESINTMIEEHKDEPEPLTLGKPEIKRIFEDNHVPDQQLEHFDDNFSRIAGDDTELLAVNIAAPKKFSIETPDIIIKVNSEKSDLIEAKMIDGRNCLVIPMENEIVVNGVSLSTGEITPA